MSDYKPVPKVIAQTVAGVITALVIAGLASYGVADTPAQEIGALAGALAVSLLPVVVGAIAGYAKTDTERAELLRMLAELMQPEDDAHDA